jgi:hypothetical protein
VALYSPLFTAEERAAIAAVAAGRAKAEPALVVARVALRRLLADALAEEEPAARFRKHEAVVAAAARVAAVEAQAARAGGSADLPPEHGEALAAAGEQLGLFTLSGP